jgi:hypothetical protein
MTRSLPRAAAAAILSVLALAGCMSRGSSPAVPQITASPVTPASSAVVVPSPSAVSTPPVTHPPASTHPPSAAARTRYPADWKLPDRKLSPGAVQPGYTIADICPHVNPALEDLRPSTSEKDRVYAAYGITHHVTGQYEIDHIVPIELLGEAGASLSDPTRNLYPELNDTPDPAAIAREHLDPAFVHNSKDILEDVLHRDVCDGQVPLATAQHAIATDWRTAYVRYVGPPPRLAIAPAPAHAAIAPPSAHLAVVSHPATHTAAPAQASCYPKTSGGNCYRAGEFCRSSDLGSAGVAGNGERIRCEASGSRNRWEPA